MESLRLRQEVVSKKRHLRKGVLSLLLAISMVVGGLLPLGTPQVAAAGEVLSGIVLPNAEENSVSGIFDYIYRTYGDTTANLKNPLHYYAGTPANASDGTDIVRIAWMDTYMGAIVSKNKVNILDNDFEFSGDFSMVNGNTVGDRGLAFVFHNDPEGQYVMGGESGNLGIHGKSYALGRVN